MKKNKIIPANVNPGYLPIDFVRCLAKSYKALPQLGEILTETSSLPNMARTKNGLNFLRGDGEWMLLVDSDQAWEPQAIIQLLRTAKEKKVKIVSGMTFMQQQGRIIPHAYQRITDQKVLAPYAVLPSLTEPFKVTAVGGGCLLVHREVIEKVKEMTDGTTSYYWWEETFDLAVGKMTGEDITFCERASAAGFEIWYEPKAIFGHADRRQILGPLEYLGFLRRSNIEHAHLRTPDIRSTPR